MLVALFWVCNVERKRKKRGLRCYMKHDACTCRVQYLGSRTEKEDYTDAFGSCLRRKQQTPSSIDFKEESIAD